MTGSAAYDSSSYDAGLFVGALTLLFLAMPVATVIIGAVKGRAGLGCLFAFLCAPLGLLILPFLSNKRRSAMPTPTVQPTPTPPSPQPSQRPTLRTLAQRDSVDLEELRRRMRDQR